MALQVWLPLNGNLRNYGLNEGVIMINNGATINNSGKIGKCYVVGNNKYISGTLDINSSPISASFWLYLNSFQGSYNYIISLNNTGGYSDQCLAIALESEKIIVFDIGGNSSLKYTHTESLVNKWTHITITFNGAVIKGYINGLEVCSLSSTSKLVRTNFTIGCRNGNTSYYTDCKINDVRLYDTCLTPVEVKEISQGLVAHYKLSDTLNDTNTLCDSSGYGYHGTCTSTSKPIIETNSPRHQNCVKFDTTAKYFQITGLPALDVYSISWWMLQPSSGASKMPWGYSNGNRLNFFGYYCNTGDGSSNPYYKPGTTTTIDLPPSGVWHHMVQVGDGTTVKLYMDGILYGQAKTYKAITGTSLILNGWSTSTDYKLANAELSDFRLYATALSETDIKTLYDISAIIDNKANVHGYEISEVNTGRELMITKWTTPFSNNTTSWTQYSHDGIYFDAANQSVGSDYIEISPSGNKYVYDCTISVASGNQFYIGFERYDENKTARSNSACIYVFTTKPSSDIVKQRYTGVVNLSTDGTNPCKYIRLRILNGWTGTDSSSTKIATVHQLSLREVPTSTDSKTRLLKTGVFQTDLLREGETAAKIEKNIDMNINEFIEI